MSDRMPSYPAPSRLVGGLKHQLRELRDADETTGRMLLRNLIGRAYAEGHDTGYLAGVDDAFCSRDHAQPDAPRPAGP